MSPWAPRVNRRPDRQPRELGFQILGFTSNPRFLQSQCSVRRLFGPTADPIFRPLTWASGGGEGI
jgi:hypothetical protein